ncbi:MAG: peptidoglycan editing factor PgeF [Burkholderiales bacterium]|nr:peptidoglycan editing factor PgeF [Burkholderiales bacterium]
MKNKNWITPDWPAPPNVRALITTRTGGVSHGPYASMNPADHVGDDPQAVAANRALLRAQLPSEPFWLKQVHGDVVAEAGIGPVEADACIARAAEQVCVVLTADCLPVLFCAADGSVVGAAHAGWRGLCAGVLERTVAAMGVPGQQVLAYLGPAIGPLAFEVGLEVREAFMALDDTAAAAFAPQTNGKYLADLYLLARQRLARVGVTQVSGGGECTYRDAERFFSYRRDGATGRMAALVWIDSV